MPGRALVGTIPLKLAKPVMDYLRACREAGLLPEDIDSDRLLQALLFAVVESNKE